MDGKFIKRAISLFTLVAFVFTSVPSSFAQTLVLPAPGQMVSLSSAFHPPVLRGLQVYSQDPFRFDFILSPGDDTRQASALKDDAGKLIRYFLASLTVPENDLWVNLSPYEKDRIITPEFGETEMGRDLLSQDYMLKQITASVIYPEGDLGKKFWARVYQEAQKKYGTTDIPVDTFNKVWIMPDKAVVYEDKDKVFITQSRLKVMLESDYLAASKDTGHLTLDTRECSSTGGVSGASSSVKCLVSSVSPSQDIAKSVLREIVIPILEKEVNEGENFATLRQVYQSLILAAWYKKKMKESILSQVYVDQKKVKGVEIDDPQMPEKIWAQYVEAFKKGAYNYIKEEKDTLTGELIPRKYFSGGVTLAVALQTVPVEEAMQVPGDNFRITTQIRPQGAGELERAMSQEQMSPAVRTEGTVFSEKALFDNGSLLGTIEEHHRSLHPDGPSKRLSYSGQGTWDEIEAAIQKKMDGASNNDLLDIFVDINDPDHGDAYEDKIIHLAVVIPVEALRAKKSLKAVYKNNGNWKDNGAYFYLELLSLPKLNVVHFSLILLAIAKKQSKPDVTRLFAAYEKILRGRFPGTLLTGAIMNRSCGKFLTQFEQPPQTQDAQDILGKVLVAHEKEILADSEQNKEMIPMVRWIPQNNQPSEKAQATPSFEIDWAGDVFSSKEYFPGTGEPSGLAADTSELAMARKAGKADKSLHENAMSAQDVLHVFEAMEKEPINYKGKKNREPYQIQTQIRMAPPGLFKAAINVQYVFSGRPVGASYMTIDLKQEPAVIKSQITHIMPYHQGEGLKTKLNEELRNKFSGVWFESSIDNHQSLLDIHRKLAAKVASGDLFVRMENINRRYKKFVNETGDFLRDYDFLKVKKDIYDAYQEKHVLSSEELASAGPVGGLGRTLGPYQEIRPAIRKGISKILKPGFKPGVIEIGHFILIGRDKPGESAMTKYLDEVAPIWELSMPVTRESQLDDLVEEPMLNAAKLLYRWNIRTLQTSAGPDALQTGKAWMTLEFDTLSPENQQVVRKNGWQITKNEDNGQQSFLVEFDVDETTTVYKLEKEVWQFVQLLNPQLLLWGWKSREDIIKLADEIGEAWKESDLPDIARVFEKLPLYDPQEKRFYGSAELKRKAKAGIPSREKTMIGLASGKSSESAMLVADVKPVKNVSNGTAGRFPADRSFWPAHVRDRAEELEKTGQGIAAARDGSALNYRKATGVPYEETVSNSNQDLYDNSRDEKFGPIENRINLWANNQDVRRAILELVRDQETGALPDNDEAFLGRLKDLQVALLMGTGPEKRSYYYSQMFFSSPSGSEGKEIKRLEGVAGKVLSPALTSGRIGRLRSEFRAVIDEIHNRDQHQLDMFLTALVALYREMMKGESGKDEFIFTYGNNSLAMNMVNALLRLNGLEGISHGTLEFIVGPGKEENLREAFKVQIESSNGILDWSLPVNDQVESAMSSFLPGVQKGREKYLDDINAALKRLNGDLPANKVATEDQVLALFDGNEMTGRLAQVASLLRANYAYDMRIKETENADTLALGPLGYAIKTGRYFKIGHNLYISPATESFRRHFIFKTTKEEEITFNDVAFAFEFMIPGDYRWKVTNMRPEKRQEIAEKLKGEFKGQDYSVDVLRAEKFTYVPGKWYDQKEPPQENGKVSKGDVGVFAYPLDGSRLTNVSEAQKKVLAQSIGITPKELDQRITQGAIQCFLAIRAAGYLGGTDGHPENYRLGLVYEDGKVKDIKVQLVADFGGFKTRLSPVVVASYLVGASAVAASFFDNSGHMMASPEIGKLMTGIFFASFWDVNDYVSFFAAPVGYRTLHALVPSLTPLEIAKEYVKARRAVMQESPRIMLKSAFVNSLALSVGEGLSAVQTGLGAGVVSVGAAALRLLADESTGSPEQSEAAMSTTREGENIKPDPAVVERLKKIKKKLLYQSFAKGMNYVLGDRFKRQGFETFGRGSHGRIYYSPSKPGEFFKAFKYDHGMNELRSLIALESVAGIPKFLDWGFDRIDEFGMYIWIKMKGIENAKDITKSREVLGKLTARQRLQKLIAVAKILENIHKLGMSHNDVKPDNIIINEEGEIMLIALGLVKAIGEEQKNGANDYRAPEIIKQGTSDVYSLGRTMNHILLEQHYDGAIAQDLESLRERMIHEDPDKRPSIRDVIDALEAIVQKADQRQAQAGTQPSVQSAPGGEAAMRNADANVPELQPTSVEQDLATMEFTIDSSIGKGASEGFFVTLSNGQRAVAKVDQLGVQSGKAELAAYRLSRLLQVGNAPETVRRRINWRQGCLQKFVDGEKDYSRQGEQVLRQDFYTDKMKDLQVFWYLIGDRDKGLYGGVQFNGTVKPVETNNYWIMPDGEPVSIDHGRAFRSGTDQSKFSNYLSGDILYWNIVPSAALRARLEQLTEEKIRAALSDGHGGLLLDLMEFRELLARRDIILAKSEKAMAPDPGKDLFQAPDKFQKAFRQALEMVQDPDWGKDTREIRSGTLINAPAMEKKFSKMGYSLYDGKDLVDEGNFVILGDRWAIGALVYHIGLPMALSDSISWLAENVQQYANDRAAVIMTYDQRRYYVAVVDGGDGFALDEQGRLALSVKEGKSLQRPGSEGKGKALGFAFRSGQGLVISRNQVGWIKGNLEGNITPTFLKPEEVGIPRGMKGTAVVAVFSQEDVDRVWAHEASAVEKSGHPVEKKKDSWMEVGRQRPPDTADRVQTKAFPGPIDLKQLEPGTIVKLSEGDNPNMTKMELKILGKDVQGRTRIQLWYAQASVTGVAEELTPQGILQAGQKCIFPNFNFNGNQIEIYRIRPVIEAFGTFEIIPSEPKLRHELLYGAIRFLNWAQRPEYQISFPKLHPVSVLKNPDTLSLSSQPKGDEAEKAMDKGGIDLTAKNMDLQTTGSGERIKFKIDSAMLQKLQDAPGFTAVIIDIQPLESLPEFLGTKRPGGLVYQNVSFFPDPDFLSAKHVFSFPKAPKDLRLGRRSVPSSILC